MNTPQLNDQRLSPTKETESEKAEPLLSIQQTPIDHSIDVMIDSSGLVMVNGISLDGSIEYIFTRLTRRLVFEFLGGHAKMEELPCLGDLADGNDEFHRITPSPTFSKSSQFKLLDATGHLHPSSIVFMDSDFNPRIVDYLCKSVLLDSYDASSTTFISSLEHFLSKSISQPADHTIEESHQCSPINKVVDEKISGLMAESLCDSEVSESQVFMKSNGFSSGIDLMSAPIPVSCNQSDKENSEKPVSKTPHPEDSLNSFDMKINKPEVHNSLVNASIIHPTCNGDSISSMDCILLEHPCNNSFENSNKLATISTAESSPKFSIPDPKHLNEFLYGILEFPMFLASELPDEKIYTFDYPSLLEDSDSVDDGDVADLSDNKFNDQSNEGVCCYDKKTSNTPGLLVGSENGSTSGEYKEMEISDPCNTELLVTNWPTADLSSFDVSGHEELLESYGLNNLGQYTDVDYTCASPTWPEKVDAAGTEGNQMNLTDLASNEDSPGCFYDENSKSSDSSIHFEKRKCALNTSTHVDSSEEYLSQGHLSKDEFENPTKEPISGTTEKSFVYFSCPHPDTLGDFLFGNLNSPTFLAAELQVKKVDIIDSSFGGSCSDDCADVTSSTDNCNLELFESDSSNNDPIAFPFDFSDLYELLETNGINIREMLTSKIYEENSENSVSLCHLNQMECAFDTSSPRYAGSMDCAPPLHSCSDDSGDSIEYQSLQYDGNELKFAFPDPNTLKDIFFGSLESPKFLASELLDGKIDTLDYPSFFGGCDLDHRTEGADLSDKMVFEKCFHTYENSINKFSILDKCSIELLDVTSYPFNISDHDKLLERYGIDDQDQLIDGNWTCDSPTWPGKI